MLYLDTSALVKLVFEEAESDALSAWLQERADVPKLSAELARIELLRTCRRVDRTAVPAARELLLGINLIALTPEVVEIAAVADPPEVRSLDSIHLASAASVSDNLTAFVVYDVRLGAAVSELGLPVEAPR